MKRAKVDPSVLALRKAAKKLFVTKAGDALANDELYAKVFGPDGPWEQDLLSLARSVQHVAESEYEEAQQKCIQLATVLTLHLLAENDSDDEEEMTRVEKAVAVAAFMDFTRDKWKELCEDTIEELDDDPNTDPKELDKWACRQEFFESQVVEAYPNFDDFKALLHSEDLVRL